jgi:hypothetical protein
MTDKPHSGYGKVPSRAGRWLLRTPLVALASHWTFQSLIYMDATERWFKVGLDAALTAGIGIVASFWLSWPIAWVTAFLLAHTLNFLFNGHIWGALKHYGLVRHTQEEFKHKADVLLMRVRREPSIERILVGGGWWHGEWSPTSDFDVRLIRRPGWRNGLRACWFVLNERARAFFSGLALDVYVLDSDEALAGTGFEGYPS